MLISISNAYRDIESLQKFYSQDKKEIVLVQQELKNTIHK